MKRYYLTYNYPSCGDVLMIMFDVTASLSHFIRKGDVALLYDGPRLIGVNVFDISTLVKIKCRGVILTPPSILITILNQKFDNEGIDVFLPSFVSGFTVGKVVDKKDDRSITVDLGSCKINVTLNAMDVKLGDLAVIVAPATLSADGTLTKPETNSYRLAVEADIELGTATPNCSLRVNENAIVGSDYFS